MIFASDVFNAAMGIMDELDSSGNPQTKDTQEYIYRTPSILNMLIAELNMLLGNEESWIPVENLESFLTGINDNYGRGILPYGLAANLLVDENPTAARFYQQRYEEMRDRFIANQPASVDSIDNVYGGFEYNYGARW